ncbi:BldC family transcriptional regulator [Sphaerisporangium sp. TRM90804]|uniref:BldC family transcriptional regulator n=1 Tax=Sphaerisporangium sp. TRM90804 TaxID=3031113 RepID=UPI00244987C4|nr:BldC family transcriptional regulator [Sphaerisporangium sp. TRM90804]MDH2425729.1 BldC family transcriptional regulator [Sphaerisporangium sp. TRM90804]
MWQDLSAFAEILTPAEVAAIFRVDPRTVTRWAKQGHLTHFWTLGGHRRFHRDEVQTLINGQAGGDR